MYGKAIGICQVKGQNVTRLELMSYGQGIIFKDWEAFETRSSKPCYCPELILDVLPDEAIKYVYSYKDFFQIAEKNRKIAQLIFSLCDWQCPETELDNLLQCQILARCNTCGKLWIVDDENELENGSDCHKCRKK